MCILNLIEIADWVLDLGPGGGVNGGEIVAEGTPEQVAANERSFTGQYLKPVLARAPKPVLVDTPAPKKRARKSGADQLDLLPAK